MNVLPGYMSLHHECALCPWRPEDGTGQPGTGVTNMSHCEGGGTQTQVQEDQPVLLTAESIL